MEASAKYVEFMVTFTLSVSVILLKETDESSGTNIFGMPQETIKKRVINERNRIIVFLTIITLLKRN